MKLRCKPLSVFLSFPALVIALILSQVSAQYDVPNIRGAINSDPGAYRDSGAGGTTAAEITSILTDMHRADSGSGLGKLNSIFEQGRKRIRESAIRRNRRRLRDEAVTSESNNDRRRLVPGGDIGERKSAPFQSSRRLCANGDDYVKSIFIITAALSPFWNDTTSTEPLYVAAAEGLAREFTTDLDGTFTITNPELGQRLELKNLFVNLDEAAGDLYLWKQDDNEVYLDDASKENPFEDYFMDVPRAKSNQKLIIQDKDQFRPEQVWSFNAGCKNCGFCDNTWRPAGVKFSSEKKELCVTAEITKDGEVDKNNAILLTKCKRKGIKRMKQTWIFCGQAVKCKEDGFDVKDVNPPQFEVRVEYKLDENTLDLGEVPQAIDDLVEDVACSGVPSSKSMIVQSENVDKMERFDVELKKHCNNDGPSSTKVDLRILSKNKGAVNYNKCVEREIGSENCNSQDDKNVEVIGNSAINKEFFVALSDDTVNSTGLEFNLDITHRGRYGVETDESKKLSDPWDTVDYGTKCIVKDEVFPSITTTPELSIWYFKLEKNTLRVDADDDVVYPNPSITVRSTCDEFGDNNAATLFQLFEVIETTNAYICVESFQTDCTSLIGEIPTTFDDMDKEKKYALVVTQSLESPDCEFGRLECSNEDL